MGVVYKARDPKINRVVAVKTIALAGQSKEDEQEFRERFFREAEAAGRLSHPGIVTIFDVGEEPETRDPYIVMEFVGGQSLDQLLASCGQKLPVATSLQLALELAEALDCAHGQGVVHRDLKPANILMTDDGKPKIADFGVAKLNLGNLTHAGRAIGTPAYMAPEQLHGELVDGRADLFSLGVILYTILTGHRPFQGNSAITISFRVVNRDPVPATLLDSTLPPGLDYIIGRAIAKDPAQRYQRGMEMVFDIQALQEGREPWSKDKQSGRTSEMSAAQMAKDASSSAQARNGGPGAHAAGNLVPLRQSWGEDLHQNLRKKARIGALLFMGLLACGLLFVSLNRRPPVETVSASLPISAPPLPVKVRSQAGPDDALATSDPQFPQQEEGTNKTVTAPTANVAAPRGALANGNISRSSTAKPAISGGAATIARKAELAADNTGQGQTSNAADQSQPAKVEHAAAAANPVTLQIEIDHKFAEGHISIWVDDNLKYTHVLEGNDKKRLVVFHRVQGHQLHVMQLTAGRHRLRVRVTSSAASGGGNYDQYGTVDGEFRSNQDNLLHVKCVKRGGMEVTLQ